MDGAGDVHHEMDGQGAASRANCCPTTKAKEALWGGGEKRNTVGRFYLQPKPLHKSDQKYYCTCFATWCLSSLNNPYASTARTLRNCRKNTA